MSRESELEREVRNVIQRNRWFTLSTASPRGAPQGSVVVYASDGYTIYVLTGKRSVKFRNIARNPQVSVTIPFYKSLIHRLITIAPPAAISFRATAEIIEFEDREATAFYERRLGFSVPEDVTGDAVWLRLTPMGSATCHGVGVRLWELRDPEKAHRVVRLTRG
jgi:general stress protein 26